MKKYQQLKNWIITELQRFEWVKYKNFNHHIQSIRSYCSDLQYVKKMDLAESGTPYLVIINLIRGGDAFKYFAEHNFWTQQRFAQPEYIGLFLDLILYPCNHWDRFGVKTLVNRYCSKNLVSFKLWSRFRGKNFVLNFLLTFWRRYFCFIINIFL